jgi:hypothetical protein
VTGQEARGRARVQLGSSGQSSFWPGPIKGSLLRAARPFRPPDLQHPPRLHLAVLLPAHHDRLDHLPVALPTGEAGRSSARQPEVPGPGRGLA